MSDALAKGLPDDFFARLSERGMSPGWAKREPAMWAEPRKTFIPAVWRYADALAALNEASAFISPEFAERRNLILANPIEGNHYATCRHLVAAYQLVLPGETARSHRHSPNALRLVLDSAEGAYTLVDGLKIDMAPNDVVLTPQWHWHGHANYSDAPAFWIDFLDVPLVQNLGNMFFEHHPDTLETVRGHAPNSELRCIGDEALARASAEGSVRVGEAQMPTIALHMIALRRGQQTDARGYIDNNILVMTRGEAKLSVETLGTISITRGDIVVVPSWYDFAVEGASDGATMLRVSDAPVFEKLRFRDVGRER
jgi:gentisate 1,2-dioxygenase